VGTFGEYIWGTPASLDSETVEPYPTRERRRLTSNSGRSDDEELAEMRLLQQMAVAAHGRN
jgi:hypothetical protein